MAQHKVLILGAGFGGFYTTQKILKEIDLNETEVTLVNRNNLFTYVPLLPESIAKMAMEPAVTSKIEEFVDVTKVRFITAEVTALDLMGQKVQTSAGELSYDYLVIALGSKVIYFGTEGAAENCFVLKTFEDITKIRTAIDTNGETAKQATDPTEKQKWQRVAIIGAGPSGVELASKINELNEHRDKDEQISVSIIEKTEKILPSFDVKSSQKATGILRKQNIEIRTEASIASIGPNVINFVDGSKLEAGVIIWTAGVGANAPEIMPEVQVDRARRLSVDSKLRLLEFPNVFAMGDIASSPNKAQQVLPTLAQVAQKQSTVVAHNILASLKSQALIDFEFTPKIMIVTLGKWRAIAKVSNQTYTGPIVWLMSLCVYMLRLPSTEKKFIMLKQLILSGSD
jgi:NADH dehydrogenase